MSHPEREFREQNEDAELEAELAERQGRAATASKALAEGKARALDEAVAMPLDGKANGEAIPTEVVNAATATLPDEQRHVIRWIHALQVDTGISLRALGAKCGVSGPVLSQVFRGVYPADVRGVCVKLVSFRKRHEHEQAAGKAPFIPTALTEQIWNICESTRLDRRVSFIFGDSQTGKTEALTAYARRTGDTVYVVCPAAASLRGFAVAVAEAMRLKVGTKMETPRLRSAILRQLNDRTLLIVDECHEALLGPYAAQVYEFIRQLFDLRQCGLLMCGTSQFKSAIEVGDLQPVMQQMYRRRFVSLPLPSEPSRDELNTFAAHFGLEPAEGEARKLEALIIRRDGLGMWLQTLRMGKRVAAAKKAELAWSHVLAADLGRRHLETTALSGVSADGANGGGAR